MPMIKAKRELDSWLQSQHDISSSKWDDLEKIETPNAMINTRHIPLIERRSSVYEIAKGLINDEKLSVCRETGIMKKRESSPRRGQSPRRHDKRNRSRNNSPKGSDRSDWSRHSSRSASRDQRRIPDRRQDGSDRRRSPDRRRGRHQRYNKEEPWSRELRRAFSPSRERERAGESDRSWFSDDTDSSSSTECRAARKPRKVKKTKSGINAKPCSKVKIELTYPHFSLGQLSGFMGAPISYHNLNYEQFVAGEMCTIMNTDCPSERRGRVTLLQKITNWKLMINASWIQIRNTYAHVLRKIENEEIDWTADFDKFEKHIFEKVSIRAIEKTDKSERPSYKRSIAVQNRDWFCKQFQKSEGCPKESPHIGKVGTQNKTVQHFCAACWLKDRSTKKWHSESSPECPLKEI